MNAREKQREIILREQYRAWYERKMIDRWVANLRNFGFAEKSHWGECERK